MSSCPTGVDSYSICPLPGYVTWHAVPRVHPYGSFTSNSGSLFRLNSISLCAGATWCLCSHWARDIGAAPNVLAIVSHAAVTWGANISLRPCFPLFWVDTQMWGGWILGYLYASLTCWGTSTVSTTLHHFIFPPAVHGAPVSPQLL